MLLDIVRTVAKIVVHIFNVVVVLVAALHYSTLFQMIFSLNVGLQVICVILSICPSETNNSSYSCQTEPMLKVS